MTATANPKAPTYRAYTVKGEGKKSRWIDIGAAWPSRDRQGVTLILDALPLDGRIVIREIAGADAGEEVQS